MHDARVLEDGNSGCPNHGRLAGVGSVCLGYRPASCVQIGPDCFLTTLVRLLDKIGRSVRMVGIVGAKNAPCSVSISRDRAAG
jgi:hypothetical protein